MPEENLHQQEPQQPVEQAQSTQPKQEEDLLSRVTKYQEDNDPEKQETPIDINKDSSFDLKEIESMTDPVAKEQAMKAYKSFQRGFNQKFQELADLKKQLQATMQSPNTQEWTPERVQQLTQDPSFVRAAQQIAGQNMSEEEYSALSDSEKARLQKVDALEREILTLKRLNESTIRQQQHSQYAQKYANYDAQKVDEITADIIARKISPTSEHIYKAFWHDENVKKAYEMGRKDERLGVSEKVQSMSVQGLQTNESQEQLAPKEGESNRNFWTRLVEKNLKAANVKS